MYADNPVSWAVLLVLAIILGIWFAKKINDELAKKEREFYENDKW